MGAETSTIKDLVARNINAAIVKTWQEALRADGVTPLAVVEESRLVLSRAHSASSLTLSAQVVNDMDVDVLAGTQLMITNDISVRPARNEKVLIQAFKVIRYNSEEGASSHT